MKPSLNIVRRTLSAALLFAAAAASGCASDPSDGDPSMDLEDTDAPTVASSLPAANATGVSATDKIVVTFSEPMDPGTVENSYDSVLLPLDKVSFSWNSELTVLTNVSPDAPLVYAEGTGTDPQAVTPYTYSLQFGADAADLAGNRLGSPMNLSFATKRRMTASFWLDMVLSRVTVTISSLGNTEMMIGDNQYGNTYRSYLTFNMATLPAGAVIEEAQFSAYQLAPEGGPYSLGSVDVQHITYNDANAGALTAAPAISLPGMFSSNANTEKKTIGVTSQVNDDVINRAARNNRSQYRLQIEQGTNNDPVTDRAIFDKDSFELTATYVVD